MAKGYRRAIVSFPLLEDLIRMSEPPTPALAMSAAAMAAVHLPCRHKSFSNTSTANASVSDRLRIGLQKPTAEGLKLGRCCPKFS